MTEKNYSFTTKINGDLFTIRGDNSEEFLNNVLKADEAIGALLELQKAITNGKLPKAKSVEDLRPKPASEPNPFENKYESIKEKDMEELFCTHGQMVHRNGISKTTGKPYNAMFCPEPITENKCKPVFIN